MMNTDPNQVFDAYSSNYDEALQRGVSLSGEAKEYFALHRIQWLRRVLPRSPDGFRVLDFGCGTGTSGPYLLDHLVAREVVGVDVSAASIDMARQLHRRPGLRFTTQAELDPAERFDLVFCNGVFHHIPLAERAGAARFVANCLKPGGFFAFWENNPWNPGTHWVMARIPFDRDAIKLFPREAVRLVRHSGLERISVTFAFIFPKILSALRCLEPALSRLPLGAQYQVLARKPDGHAVSRQS